MEQKAIFLILILFCVQVNNSKQDEPDFCSGSEQVDAASFSAVDRRNLMLFSGAYYWELDVDSKRVIRSHKISDTFPTVEDNVDAACSVSSLGDGGYMFMKGRKAWTFVGIKNVKLNVTLDWYTFAEKHDFKFGSDHPGIGCAACFCHDPENCHVILVDKGTSKKSIGCLFNYGQTLTKCQLFQYIQLPERVKEDLLNNLGECYGLAYAMDPDRPTIIVAADKTHLYYYQNNNLIYSTLLTDIFGCWSAETKNKVLFYAVGSALLFMLILCIIVIVVRRIKVASREEASPLMRETIEPAKVDSKQKLNDKTAKTLGKSKYVVPKVAKTKDTPIVIKTK